MFVVPGRLLSASTVTALLAVLALLIGATPVEARPAALTQPAITFPDGPRTTTGGTIRVTFDAAGDRRVTAFRYSLDGAALDNTVAATVRGGTATVRIDVGASAGDRLVYAVAVDRRGRTGPANQSVFVAEQTVQFQGTVIDSSSWRPVEGATVTLQPGGRQETTDARGAFAFSGLAPGEYTATATTGGACPLTATQTLLIGRHGLEFQFLLFPPNGEPCPATLSGVVLDDTPAPVAGATVTLEPGGSLITTDASGSFRFPDLPAGDYWVTAAAEGGDCGLNAYGSATLSGRDESLELRLYPADCP